MNDLFDAVFSGAREAFEATMDRLTGRESPAAWVTVLADVTNVVGERWRSTDTAPLVERDGVWYLTRPLFA